MTRNPIELEHVHELSDRTRTEPNTIKKIGPEPEPEHIFNLVRVRVRFDFRTELELDGSSVRFGSVGALDNPHNRKTYGTEKRQQDLLE